jgi:endoglucanase
MKELLQKLVETHGPSGYEDAVRKVVLREVKPLAGETRVDALGNVIARIPPARNAKNPRRIMLAAHMDEIGLIVSHVDDKGFVRFAKLGGVPGRVVLGARVQFLNGIRGVLGCDRLEKSDGPPPINKMFIDVGAASRRDCPVKVGEVGAFERSFIEVGNRLAAGSMDDRAGVTALIETMRSLSSPANDVYFVFTTQQEVGARGAGPAALGIEADIGIAVDVTPSGDTPASSRAVMELGRGPSIKIRDEGMIADPRVVEWMIATAEKARIPYQREVSSPGSSDAGQMQIAGAGVKAGALSIPLRYLHSPSEMVDFADLQNSIKLLTVLLSRPVPF